MSHRRTSTPAFCNRNGKSNTAGIKWYLWGACMWSSYFDSSVGGFSHGLQQLVVLWVKCHGKGTVNDPSCRHTEENKEHQSLALCDGNLLWQLPSLPVKKGHNKMAMNAAIQTSAWLTYHWCVCRSRSCRHHRTAGQLYLRHWECSEQHNGSGSSQ